MHKHFELIYYDLYISYRTRQLGQGYPIDSRYIVLIKIQTIVSQVIKYSEQMLYDEVSQLEYYRQLAKKLTRQIWTKCM